MDLFPCRNLIPNQRLDRLPDPKIYEEVVIYAKGRFRRALVIKVTPTRVLVQFCTPAAPRYPRELYRHKSGPWTEVVYVSNPRGEFQITADPRSNFSGHRLVNHETRESAR